ncbi:MAG: DNA repair protein RecN [Salaquimonas sp.]|nr:DNA repair protein RecN [Salaquimonas sp.]
MLVQLSIRDIVLIERLDIDFPSGLSVLTGETGAGKSILLDALSLALGARGDGALVRSGAAQGQVTAVFEPEADHPVRAILSENAIETEGGVILRRVQGADGRSRAFINDAPVSVALMHQIGRALVEIHGQHDDRALIDAHGHRALLDAYGGIEAEAGDVASAWERWQKARRDLEALRGELDHGAREADYLRASVEELTKLAPEPGEEEALAEKRSRMMKVEKIATDLNEAVETLGGGASPIPTLSNLLRRLERKGAEVPGLLDEAIEHFDKGLSGLLDAQAELERALHDTEFDPGELERAEERLFALRAASRKFSVPVADLPDLAVRMADELSLYDSGSERLAELERRVAALEAEYGQLAGELSRKRSLAGEALEKTVEAELPALKLERAKFIIRIDSDKDQPGANGIDRIEFWVQTNPGTRAGPLMKVASGGELSRFLLALKVSLADKGSAPTLVFDEIDSGVGGAVSDAIGQRLKRLSERVQVLSVTHAPQVAARADEHYLISKAPVEGAEDGEDAREDRVATVVEALAGEHRREEIARMLAGASVTQEARAAAEKLIVGAAG